MAPSHACVTPPPSHHMGCLTPQHKGSSCCHPLQARLHHCARLQDTLARLCGKYSRVFYVPGNHELWVTEKAHRNSVTKFFEILDICDQIGVLYVPAPVARRTRIYPLFTWHSADLGDPDVRLSPSPKVPLHTSAPVGCGSGGDGFSPPSFRPPSTAR